MKKRTITVAAAILLIGVIVMTGLIFSGNTDASPFEYRANTTANNIY